MRCRFSCHSVDGNVICLDASSVYEQLLNSRLQEAVSRTGRVSRTAQQALLVRRIPRGRRLQSALIRTPRDARSVYLNNADGQL